MVANLDNVKIDDIITLHCQDWRVYNEKNRKESSDGHIILDISTCDILRQIKEKTVNE